jgi:hypothetical protein
MRDDFKSIIFQNLGAAPPQSLLDPPLIIAASIYDPTTIIFEKSVKLISNLEIFNLRIIRDDFLMDLHKVLS